MSKCKWNGGGEPRVIGGRHDDLCNDETCRGCQPCTEPHCRICGVAHHAGTCAECLAETREALRDIARMCDALPEEVEHRGINGEAMMLLGPAADPEARGHVEASYMSGRLPEEWIEAAHGDGCPLLVNEACTGCAGGELHPYTVLGGWDLVWRDAWEQDAAGRPTISDLVEYLDRNLHRASGDDLMPFEDFARDVRGCRTHLEVVLHDGEQVDRGAPCMTCHRPLTRIWGDDTSRDGWECQRCRTTSTEAQYRFAVMADHEQNADWLTAEAMERRTAVKAGTVRVWASKGWVKKRRHSERTEYAVADVAARAGDDTAA